MSGRHPSGPEFVEKLQGTAKAKLRARVLLETVAGSCRVLDACAQLGIKEARFDQLRYEGLQAIVDALEEQRAGRKPRGSSPAEIENERLRERITQLETEREALLIRAELAVGLPKVGEPAQKNGGDNPIEAAIVNHLKNLIPHEPVSEGPPRRGFAGQRAERENEQVVRRHVVEFGQRIVEEGWNWTETADLFGLSPRTLRDWRFDFTRNFLRAVPLGRPILGATREQRNEVIHYLDEWGPGLGIPCLRDAFPDLARAELEDIYRRYRRVWRKRNQQPIHVLHWTTPGAVWAIDFHGPRDPIDGLYPNLLAVRDLASGQQLLWLPTRDMTAATTIEALTSLFIQHGAPLVLKSDNGSAFIDGDTQKLLAQFQVKNLFSPVREPSYNGAIEAGIGSLKTRTEQHAARHGHPGYWIWDDAEAARLEANATSRPRGPNGPSPDQLWQRRSLITNIERALFQNDVAARLQEIELDQGTAADNNHHTMAQRANNRQAIRHALVERGYLEVSRRFIPLPIPSQKTADIM